MTTRSSVGSRVLVRVKNVDLMGYIYSKDDERIGRAFDVGVKLSGKLLKIHGTNLLWNEHVVGRTVSALASEPQSSSEPAKEGRLMAGEDLDAKKALLLQGSAMLVSREWKRNRLLLSIWNSVLSQVLHRFLLDLRPWILRQMTLMPLPPF